MQVIEESIFPEKPVIYAGFWARFAAAFLDALILDVVIVPVAFLVGGLTSSAINLIVVWLYYALQESSATQATLGKRALGIKVTDVYGNRISFGQGTGRFFGRYLSAIILLIGYFMMLWDDRKQTLHDKMAGTLVVMS